MTPFPGPIATDAATLTARLAALGERQAEFVAAHPHFASVAEAKAAGLRASELFEVHGLSLVFVR